MLMPKLTYMYMHFEHSPFNKVFPPVRTTTVHKWATNTRRPDLLFKTSITGNTPIVTSSTFARAFASLSNDSNMHVCSTFIWLFYWDIYWEAERKVRSGTRSFVSYQRRLVYISVVTQQYNVPVAHSRRTKVKIEHSTHMGRLEIETPIRVCQTNSLEHICAYKLTYASIGHVSASRSPRVDYPPTLHKNERDGIVSIHSHASKCLIIEQNR